MDLLQDSNTKNTYDKSKYAVRQWEVQFKKKNGRLPSKLDIHEANKEVRNAYKLYFRLKTAALEESLTNIDGFDADIEEKKNTPEKQQTMSNEHIINVESNKNNSELSNKVNNDKTWGLHLNKQIDKYDEKDTQSEKYSVNLNFTQKLFENSKSKKLPRKSLSFSRKKSDAEAKPQFLSQPDYSTSSEQSFNKHIETGVVLSCVKTVTPLPTVLSQPISVVQSVLNSGSNFNHVRQVDVGWVQRVSNIVDKKHLSLQEDSDDDIIANSEDELENSCSLIQATKKRRTTSSNFSSDDRNVPENELVTIDTTSKRVDFTNLFVPQNLNKNDNSEKVLNIDEGNDKLLITRSDKTDLKVATAKNANQKTNVKTVVRKSGRLHKAIQPIPNSDIENDDPYYSENDDRDHDFQPIIERKESLDDDEEFSRQKNPAVKSKKNKKSKDDGAKLETENENRPYELEYSVKPRLATVPRFKNLKQVLTKKKKESVECEGTEKNAKPTTAEEKLLKKIESGSVNDNYVQINLKKKIYVRGKSGRSFSKYKKQMWKQKKSALCGPNMDMGGCDGGMLQCFNCGQVGHFARNCKLKKSDAFLPLEADEDVCPYPTLEEASQMAKESVLAIRPPTKSRENNEISQNVDHKSDEHFNDDFDDELVAIADNLEQEIRKIDVQKYIDMTTCVKPYYELKQDGSIIETPNEVYDTLNKFGHTTFRAGQELAIMRILSGKSTLVTLSTGTGKSLCYQLPAFLYSTREPCISLIISPLVSLMEDQVTGIPLFLKAACLHTNQTKVQKQKVLDAIKTGNLNILLVSPEAVVAGEKSTGFGSLLRQLPPIAFACIDEAHCVSQWSHNFRPSYLKICRVLCERLGVKTILGLTATATRVTSDSIIKHLSIPDGRDGIISDIPLPNNLTLTVSQDPNRDQALLALLMSERFSTCKSVIVYCTRREECQRVATFLRTCLKNEGAPQENNKKRKRYSLHAEPYHAGMAASRRKSIQKAFMSGDLRIVVATVAFGMGINKSDIRAVLHYNMPMSFESYVQEVGRAGRDGLPAHCHLFLDSQGKDENELRRHVYANSTDRHVIRKLLQRCFIPCSCASSCPRHEVAFSVQQTVQALDIPEENIETLLCYLELHKKRYIEVLSHVYVNCKIISYGGPNEIRKAAKDCPPLAMALALHRNKDEKKENVFEFPVVEVASAMGWDSGICKHKLKNLEWITENNQPKRSRLSVEFSDLGFHLLAPGNLSDSALDEVLDDLFGHVQEHERTSLLQLHAVHTTLSAAVQPTFKMCISDRDISESVAVLKSKIRAYFEDPNPLDGLSELTTQSVDEGRIKNDTRCLIAMYCDNTFTGRAVARIFHGIQSPNYPAFIWGRCKFWRAHLGTDFNAICLIATRELLKMRDI